MMLLRNDEMIAPYMSRRTQHERSGIIAQAASFAPAGASIMQKEEAPAKQVLLLFGGATQTRTGESRICSPLPYHLAMAPYTGFADFFVRKSVCVERLTRLELATSTLARWRSTG